MSEAQLIGRAVKPLIEIVRNISENQLEAPTACSEYDVRALINHLLFWGPALEGAGRKVVVPSPAPAESDIDLTQGDWASDLAGQWEQIAAAWSQPEAWQGMTQMGEPIDTPAALIGGMVMSEAVVHGWDLAASTGQQPSWDDDVLHHVYKEVAGSAPMGRDLGIYGPEVNVPTDAPVLHRILGLTGRDPS